jgi:methionyl aminopeptidase
MIAKKTPEEIRTLAEGGAVLARMLRDLAAHAVAGATTEDLNTRAIALCKTHGVEPVLLGYEPEFAPTPYPAAICTSVNNVVQHGIPSPEAVLHDGDIINIDATIGYRGLIVDSGITVGVGVIDKKAQALIDATKAALAAGIEAAQRGNRIGDISAAMAALVRSRSFSMVEALCGHGVGYAVHEEPMIPNVGKAGAGPQIEVGHVYAIEPIVNEGTKEVVFDDDGDGYGVYTKDGKRSAHFEHTVAITENGPMILTKE